MNEETVDVVCSCGQSLGLPVDPPGAQYECPTCKRAVLAPGKARMKIRSGVVSQQRSVPTTNLRQCPACSKMVSRNASACPDCGEPFSEVARVPHGAINMRDPIHVLGIIVVIVIIALTILWCINAIIVYR